MAGARLDHLIACAAVAVPLMTTVALLRGYRLSRLEAFLDPWADPFGRGYQLIAARAVPHEPSRELRPTPYGKSQRSTATAALARWPVIQRGHGSLRTKKRTIVR